MSDSKNCCIRESSPFSEPDVSPDLRDQSERRWQWRRRGHPDENGHPVYTRAGRNNRDLYGIEVDSFD